MESAFFTQSSLASPWGIHIPALHSCMMFHIVVDGHASFSIGNDRIDLEPGDFILFPKGEGHKLGDGACTHFTYLSDLPIKAITSRYEVLNFGGNGDKTTMVCGALLFQHPLSIKLLGILPTYILIKKAQQPAIDIFDNLSGLLESETQNVDVGAEAVISRLADILVINAMRQYLKGLNDEQIGWLGALSDDRIGKALNLIHEQPEYHWSLEELALKVGMSRTSFSQYFKRLVGNTLMEYLTEWRMSLAYSKLQLTKDSLLSISLDVGYQSEAAFSRAFKKAIGKTPIEVRKSYQGVS
jgi:AraC-like DNA-binding protein